MAVQLQPDDALIIVDVQLDFCPGGALPIVDGDKVVEPLNAWIAAAAAANVPVFASRDWHPAGHLSFAPHGGDWPVHCLQDDPGAVFHPDLALPQDAIVVTKGTRFDKDQMSAFDETGLAAYLRHRGIKRLWVGGLAQDCCVAATALDGIAAGFEVHLIEPATRPVTADGGAEAIGVMRAAGVVIERGEPPQTTSTR